MNTAMQETHSSSPRWSASAAEARTTSVLLALLVVVVLPAVLLVVSAGPARAHASGELPRAELTAQGNHVHIELVAPPDDAAVIGTALGLLGEGATVALLGGPADDLPTAEQIASLSRSPELRSYLADHVSVRQDGIRCPGEAHPAADFLSDGARLEFRCPAPVEQADIRITVLHDEDPAYRTFSVDGSTQYAIHSAAAPEHRWDFTATGDEGGGIDPILVGGLVVVLAGIVVAVVFIGPRRLRADA